MYCIYCGEKNDDDAAFCGNCGKPLEHTQNTRTEAADSQRMAPPVQRNIKEPKRKKKTKLWIIPLVVVLLVAVAAAAFFILKDNLGESRKRDYKSYLAQADKHLEELDYEDAEKSCLTAISVEPKKEESYLKLADLYIEQKNYKEAKKILKQGEDAATDGDQIREKLEEVTFMSSMEQELPEQYGKVESPQTVSMTKEQFDSGRDSTQNYDRWAKKDGLFTMEKTDLDQDDQDELFVIRGDGQKIYAAVYEYHDGELVVKAEEPLTETLDRRMYNIHISTIAHKEEQYVFVETKDVSANLESGQETRTVGASLYQYTGDALQLALDLRQVNDSADGSAVSYHGMVYNDDGTLKEDVCLYDSGAEDMGKFQSDQEAIQWFFGLKEVKTGKNATFYDQETLLEETAENRKNLSLEMTYQTEGEGAEMKLNYTFRFTDYTEETLSGSPGPKTSEKPADGKTEEPAATPKNTGNPADEKTEKPAATESSENPAGPEASRKPETDQSGQAIYEDYEALLAGVLKKYESTNGDNLLYTVYDLDQDGTKEVIISEGTTDAECRWAVYTLTEEGVKRLGDFPGAYSSLCVTSDGTFYGVNCHGQEEKIYEVRLTGGKLETECTYSKVKTADEKFYYPEGTYLEGKRLNDPSLLP